MAHMKDPFEAFKARKEVERLAKKIRTKPEMRAVSSENAPKPALDESRSWIY